MKPSKLHQHQEAIGEDQDFFERKKQLALSKRSTDIRKAFERAGSDLHRTTEVSFECLLLIATQYWSAANKTHLPDNCREAVWPTGGA